MVKATSEKVLKRTIKIKGRENDKEPTWLTETIKSKRKERREINRLHRKEKDENKKEELWGKYGDKKAEVQELVRIEIVKNERNLSEEIRGDNKKMWENINKLRGTKRKSEDFDVFNEDGKRIKKQKRQKKK